jgi:hypothetical protein
MSISHGTPGTAYLSVFDPIPGSYQADYYYDLLKNDLMILKKNFAE